MNVTLVPRRARRGAVLIVVLVVVAMLSLAGYTFTHMMLTHQQAAQLHGRQIQARVLVDSGVEYVRTYFTQEEATRDEMGGHYLNPTVFQAVPVMVDADPRGRGNFSVVAPNLDEMGNLAGVRYGLEDLSTRLNMNILPMAEGLLPGAGQTLLMALPGMTEDTADAILDWIDEDDEVREFGAEAESYEGYLPKNGPLDSVEELLLIRGVTPRLLFGLDTNRNGMVEQHELEQEVSGITSTSQESAAIDVTAEGMQRGWSGFLTLHSQEKNVTSLGQQRIFVNNDNLQELFQQLSDVFNEEWAVFIVAYRQAGAFDGGDSGESASGHTIDFEQEPQEKLSQVLDLIDKKVQIRFADEDDSVVLRSPFPNDQAAMNIYLPLLMDVLSVSESPTIPGRININQAPRSILLGIPGMTEELVEAIIEQRPLELDPQNEDPNLKFESWLLTTGLVDLEQMKTLMPFVTAGGDVFQAQVVGYFEDGGAASRTEAIFDTTGKIPRVVFWRDISHLGRGYPLELLGVQLDVTQ